MHLGIDLGSSSVKVALLDDTGRLLAQSSYPEREMSIKSLRAGWAEQDPNDWWIYTCFAIQKVLLNQDTSRLKSIGIAHQMHGLVVLDEKGEPLRDAIIWCDSRAIESGNTLLSHLGREYCLKSLLNLPGNFTAAKLHWLQQNEPDTFDQIHHVMLPGDFIAYKLTGKISTTIGNLSEGCFWDFRDHRISDRVLEALEIDEGLLPEVKACFEIHGYTSSQEKLTGLPDGVPVSYMGGDQPNNAYSLGVNEPGMVAGTGGTSGVIYALSGQLNYDASQRTNSFAHVNHTSSQPRIGTLLCINAAGILYSWLRKVLCPDLDYDEMELIASGINPASDGLSILPFGNGAERMLGNKSHGAQIFGIELNRHDKAHFIRAGLESLAFAYTYGMERMRELHIPLTTCRVGDDNLFQSNIFTQTLCDLAKIKIEVVRSQGAEGAARGSAQGIQSDLKNALDIKQIYSPHPSDQRLLEAYSRWKEALNQEYS